MVTLATQMLVNGAWAKIVANFSGEYGLVEKISGLTNQFVRFRFKGKKCDTIISPENVMFEIED